MRPLTKSNYANISEMRARVSSSRLPLRIVGTQSGLFAEWGACSRVRLNESAPLLMSDEQAHSLLRELMVGSWTSPPSFKLQVSYQGLDLSVGLDGLSLRDIKRAWLAALRRRYSRYAVSVCLRIFPKGANLLHLARVKAMLPTLTARLAESPSLGPLLAHDLGMWSHLPNWAVVRNRMIAMGLSAWSWRWLCRQSSAYVAKFEWNQLSHLAWVNFHVALARPIPAAWVESQTGALRGLGGLQTWLRRNHESLGNPSALFVLRGVRLALKRWQECLSRADQCELEQEEFPLLADWLLATSVQVNPITRKWTYDTLMTKQFQWHLLERDNASRLENVYWPEVLGQGMVASQIEFFELTSLNALLNEARKMHHCVPSYIDRCMAGDVCLFHLHKRGPVPERATLELRRLGASRWKISQLKGPCNARVSVGMWEAANQILASLA